jgi:hypothetical protein
LAWVAQCDLGFTKDFLTASFCFRNGVYHQNMLWHGPLVKVVLDYPKNFSPVRSLFLIFFGGNNV